MDEKAGSSNHKPLDERPWQALEKDITSLPVRHHLYCFIHFGCKLFPVPCLLQLLFELQTFVSHWGWIFFPFHASAALKARANTECLSYTSVTVLLWTINLHNATPLTLTQDNSEIINVINIDNVSFGAVYFKSVTLSPGSGRWVIGIPPGPYFPLLQRGPG